MRALAAVALAASFASAQTTWHVDVHGTPPGTGTAQDPYTSIQYAVTSPSTASGDTILVRPGVYEEHVEMAYSQRRQIVSTDGPLETVIRVATSGAALKSHALGASIEGFTLIKSSGGSTSEVVDMEDLTMRRCIVLGTPAIPGVQFSTGTIDHCLITGCLKAIQAFPHVSGVIRNSILWGNNDPFVIQSDPWASDIFIEYCVVDHLVGTTPNTNIDLPPLLRSITGHDFHPRSNSPCIDTADPAAPLDPDGSRRDIGPVSYDASYSPFQTYCTAKVNSLGCVPAIDAVGNASITASAPFEIVCVNELNHRLGLLFYGFAPASTPYQGGYFCVQTPVRRTAVLDSGGNAGPDDCSGVYTLDFNLVIQSGSDALLEPGVAVFAQFWSRDPAASFTVNRSDAISFVIAP